ncbi:hypothetical protein BH18ACT14_BH18ACT14_16360 [soil metagenome]
MGSNPTPTAFGCKPRLNPTSILADIESTGMRKRFRNYIAVVVDAEGVSYQYLSTADSRKHAENEARESLEQSGATLVSITPVEDGPVKTSRRLMRVVAITVAASGVTIGAVMIIGLSAEGAL